MRAIEEALENASELLPYAAQAEDTDIWRLAVRTAIETNAEALTLIRSMDGKQPVSWVSDCCGARMITVDTIDGPSTSCRKCSEYCHPSPQTGEPRLTIQQAMEAMALHYFEHHQKAIGHAGNPLYDSIREHFTKAAK